MQLSMHELDQLPRDGQAQARTSILTRHGVVGLHEGFEDAFHGLFLDADPCVLDLELNPVRVPLSLEGLDHDLDFALLRELDGVAQQVVEDLLQPNRVSQNLLRYLWVEFEDHLQSLLLGLICQQPDRLLDDVVEGQGGFLQGHFSRFDLGEIQ